MPSGTVTRYFPDKGFGFISADDGSGDLFAPLRLFTGTAAQIYEGMRVSYDAGTDDQTCKPRASSWSPEEGSGGGYGGGSAGVGRFSQLQGTLKKFFADKGYGFIQPHDGSCQDIFAPERTFHGQNRELQNGMLVLYEADVDKKTGKPQASSWRRLCPRKLCHIDMDPASGWLYSCDQATGETSWTLPPPPPPPPPPPLPPHGDLSLGWESASDPASGEICYVNRWTGQKTLLQ